MEKTSTNALSPSFYLASFIGFLLFDGILKWVIGFNEFYSCSRSFFGKPKSLSERKLTNSVSLKQKLSFNERVVDDGKISGEDVEMVIEKLRIVCNHDEEMMIQERLGSDELSVMFEDQEPSVEEVKEAFNVFDQNKDGFVDATELQRVLCSLGLKEGLKLEDCEKMIRVFDMNRDGRIDFSEFAKLMEISFCI